MFSTIVKSTSYANGIVRNLLRAETQLVRSISTSNDVKNSDLLTKNETVEEAKANKDIKKFKKRWVLFVFFHHTCIDAFICFLCHLEMKNGHRYIPICKACIRFEISNKKTGLNMQTNWIIHHFYYPTHLKNVIY